MDVAGIAKLATSIAETGNKQEVALSVLKRAQQLETATATQLIVALQATPAVSNLPPHLGTKVNTTA